VGVCVWWSKHEVAIYRMPDAMSRWSHCAGVMYNDRKEQTVPLCDLERAFARLSASRRNAKKGWRSGFEIRV